MSIRNTGNMARQMAAAPLPQDANPAAPTAGAAPELPATAAAPTVAVELPQTDVQADNPIVQKIGWPTFRLVSNPRWYPDDNNPAKESMRFAYADFDLGGLILSASIYREKEVVQRSTGRVAQFALRFSMPKAISVNKDDAATVLHLESFKADVMGLFVQFKSKLDPAAMQRAAKNRSTYSDGEEAISA